MATMHFESLEPPVPSRQAHARKPGKVWVLGAVGLVAALGLGFLVMSHGGDMNIFRQHLVGEVNLSNGKHSARTLHELNELSWDNGLNMLETLDKLNASLRTVKSLEAQKEPPRKELAMARSEMDREILHIHELLDDRQQLTQSARLLKSPPLYAPVYQEYLKGTMHEVAAVSNPQLVKESLVQQ